MWAVVSKALDAASILFSLSIAVAAPLFESQVVLPDGLYPFPLVRVRRWFAATFDHYLVADDPPPFFRGLVWLALAFNWPVCVANLYGVATGRRRLVDTTSLMAGVYLLTYLSALFGEVLGSERATPKKLVLLYVPFALLAVSLVLRGLCSARSRTTPDSARSSSTQNKKRV